MTTLTDTQVVTASGGLVELGYKQITSNVTISSSTAGSGTAVISPLTVVCDGSPVLVEFFSPAVRPTVGAGNNLIISLYQDGSEQTRLWSFIRQSDVNPNNVPVHLTYRVTPSAGSHTFDVRAYNSTGSTGLIEAGSGSTNAAPAFLRVSKIVQATQWPAVTTGTIICTSTTRPASPFEGQTIYETDTNKEFTYTGSAWTESALFRTANGAVVDNYRVPPMCRLVRTTDQTITIDTDTRVQFNSSVFDTNPTMATTGASAKITINTPGVYSINAYSQWTSVGVANNYRYHWVRLNLGSVRLASFRIYNPGGNMGLSSSDIVSLASGDELEMYVRSEVASSSLGSQVNMGETRASFAVAWLGQVS
jgi:hypothetical protein